MDEEEVKVDEEVKKVILSVSSDSVRAQGAARRNSTGEANAKTLPSLLSSDERVLPHYLRASTNSCHEFCKYGKKHVFEPKKMKSNLRRESGSSEIPAEEQKAEFSAPRGRRKKPELKAKTEPKGGLLEKPEVIMKNGLKEIYPGTHVVEETEPFEASESMKLQTPPSQGHIASLEHSPFDNDEESFEEPTVKRVISHEPITHLDWSEKSSDGSESMEPELPSPLGSPKSQVEGPSEEPVGVEILTPAPGTEIMAHVDESVRSNSAASSSIEKSLKAKILPLTRRSTSAKARPSVEKMTVTPVKPKVSERKSPSSVKKVIIPVSPRVAKQKTSHTTRRMATLSEPLMSLKPKAPAVKSTPSPISVSRLSAQRNMGSKIIRSIDLSKLGEDTIPKPSKVSISTKPPVGRENTDAKLMKNRSLKPSASVQSAKREVKRILIRTAPATVRTEARIPSPHNLVTGTFSMYGFEIAIQADEALLIELQHFLGGLHDIAKVDLATAFGASEESLGLKDLIPLVPLFARFGSGRVA